MRKCKVKRAGPFRIIALENYSAVSSDMNNVVHNDLVSIRKLTKILAYINTFPADVKTVGETVNATIQTDDCDEGRWIIAPKYIKKKVKTKNGVPHKLCYVYGERKTGTYMPLNKVCNTHV